MTAADDVYREALRDWYAERPFLDPEPGWLPGTHPVAFGDADPATPEAPLQPAAATLNRTVDGRR